MSLQAYERKDHGASMLSNPERWSWMNDAACAGMSINIFFPRDDEYEEHDFSTARVVCAGCPVRAECRAWNDRIETMPGNHLAFGFWGGETPKERSKRRKAERL